MKTIPIRIHRKTYDEVTHIAKREGRTFQEQMERLVRAGIAALTGRKG